MPINKIHKREHPFVQIDKRAIDDHRLSWKARGLLCYLLSKPNNWQVYVDELKKNATDGRDSTRTALNTLIEFGYVEKERKHNEDGTFAGFEYIVKESPSLSSKPINGNPENGSKAPKGNNDGKNNAKPPFKGNETINGKTIDGKTDIGLTVYGKPATNNIEVNNIDSTNKDDSKSARGNSENDDTHPLQEFVQDELPEVATLDRQLTYENCKSLISDFGKTQVHDVLLAMENYNGLNRKYKSVNLTVRNWCKKRNEDKPETKSQPKQIIV